MADVSSTAAVVVAAAAVLTLAGSAWRAVRKDRVVADERAEARGRRTATEAARLRRIEEKLGLSSPDEDDDESPDPH